MRKILVTAALAMLLSVTAQAQSYDSFATKNAQCKKIDQDFMTMKMVFGKEAAIQVIMNRINEIKYYCSDTNPAMVTGALEIYNARKQGQI